MRGNGKTQRLIGRKNKDIIHKCIESLNFERYARYATVNDIHRITGINKESIRNHTNQMLWNMEIFEIDVGYNAKGFITYLGYERIKKDKELSRIVLSNTQHHIYELKYPNISKHTEPIKSARQIGKDGQTNHKEKWTETRNKNKQKKS